MLMAAVVAWWLGRAQAQPPGPDLSPGVSRAAASLPALPAVSGGGGLDPPGASTDKGDFANGTVSESESAPAAATAAAPLSSAATATFTIRVVDQFAVPLPGVRVVALPESVCAEPGSHLSNAEGLVTFRLAGGIWDLHSKYYELDRRNPARFEIRAEGAHGTLTFFDAARFTPGPGRRLSHLVRRPPGETGVADTMRREQAKDQLRSDKFPSIMLDARDLRRLRVVDGHGEPVGSMEVSVHYKRGIEPPSEELVLDEHGETDIQLPTDVNSLWVKARDGRRYPGYLYDIPSEGAVVVTMLETVTLRLRWAWPAAVPEGARRPHQNWHLHDPETREFLGISNGEWKGDLVHLVVPKRRFQMTMSGYGETFEAEYTWDPGQGEEILIQPKVNAVGHTVRIRVLSPGGNPLPLSSSFLALVTEPFGYFELQEQEEPGEALAHLPEGTFKEIKLSRGSMFPGQRITCSTVLGNVSIPTTATLTFTFPAPDSDK